MIPALLFILFLGSSLSWADGNQQQDSNKQMLTRTYQVGVSFISTDPKWLAAAKGKQPLDVKSYLNAKGVIFPPGSNAAYTPATGRLVLTNNRDQIELFQELVNIDTPTGSHNLEPIDSKP
jgi:hypothetical protein